MEFLAKIIKGERSKNKQFWRYSFLDIQTGKEDWFLNNCWISFIPNLLGKLTLAWDKSGNYKLYQDFSKMKNLKRKKA